MMTRRGVLVESLKIAGLFAGAAVVFGCGEETGGTAAATPSKEVEDLDKKAAEAREKNKAAEPGKAK